METTGSSLVPESSVPGNAPPPPPAKYKINKGKVLLTTLSVLGVYLIVSFAMSFKGASTIQVFQKNLEEGTFKSPDSDWNPFNSLQASWHQAGSEAFKKAVEGYDGHLGALKDSYPDAVVSLVYNPKDTETLSLIARYYFLSGNRLSSERLALQAVSLNPYNLKARRAVVLCQALPPDQRLKFMGSTWSLIGTESGMIQSCLQVHGKERFYYFIMRVLGGFLVKDKSNIPWNTFISYSDKTNNKTMADLQKEADWLKFQYAFCLFLTDPLKWKEDARDCLEGEGAFADPQSQEHLCVVKAWVAEWMEDPALIAETSKRLAEVKLADPLGQKRVQDFKTAFESEKGFDLQVEALRVYDSLHPVNDPVWMRMENDALNLPDEFAPGDVEPEGGADDKREWLAQISSGEQSPLPGRKKEDYTYPQAAEVKLMIDQRLKDKVTMTPCPILMPLKDEQGHYSPMGAYLSIQAITLASFPGRQVLGFWSPFSKFKKWNLLAYSSQAHSHLLQELTADSGSDSHADGTLIEKKGGWQVTLNFQGAHPMASYTKWFKKGQLHLVPGWMAESVHIWLGNRLNKAQKAALKKPYFADDTTLNRGLVLERYDNSVKQNIPGWNSVTQKNLQSAFVLYRDYFTRKDMDGIQDLSPMENLVQKDPSNDLARFYLSVLYNDCCMYGKALELDFAMLVKDQTNTDLYENTAGALESLGDYANARLIYEKLAQRFPDIERVQEALGDFYVDYAWVARGSGWGNSVTNWNGLLFDTRLALARKLLERARTLNPQDMRIYSRLMSVGKGQSWKKEEVDRVFNQSVSVDSDYYPAFNQRLDLAMYKWGGSNDEMMAFARKWKDLHPRLLITALKELAGNQPNSNTLAYYRYLGSPQVWPELKGAYEGYFKGVDQDDYALYTEYAYDVANMDKVKEYESFIETQAKTDETLKNFRPYLVNLAYAYRAQVIGWDHAGQLYLNSPEVWPVIYGCTLQVIQQDPDNYPFLNTQAATFVGWGRFKSGRTLFEAIGDHWVPKCWDREHFDKYKRIAYRKEAPSWHVCLSSKDLAGEQ